MAKLTEADAKARMISRDAALAEPKTAEASGRFGTTEEFGAIGAFLCSQHAGYIVGQNVLVDGGGNAVAGSLLRATGRGADTFIQR